MGSHIDIDSHDGKRFRAYLAAPAQGSGPGIVLLQEIFGINDYMRTMADRFAEEGYVVLVPDLFWRMKPGVEFGYGEADFKEALGYYGVGLDAYIDEVPKIRCPMLFHFAGKDAYCPPDTRERLLAAFAQNKQIESHVYPSCDHAFATPERSHFDKPAATMAYSRTVALLRGTLGPIHDLNALWERHCYYEFGTRDVDAVMPTMVAQPYVNHVPTMTGGVGHDELKRFYRYHFVDSNPVDTRLIPISRTIGADRIVDEFVFCATHDREIDWLLPGLAPTGNYFEVPMLAVVCFRGDKLYNEHIYWDQASVLVQIGVLDPAGLPVAGIQTAKKMIDETLPTNTLMRNWASSEGKPI
ncbi:dienelactone hydrolase family protein [Burkholderia sp. BCC1630]|uniref:dienelactone hydrolase family protein n=1 Tax=Burkholderia sp. BCC1630 TaxID=2676304 RepID=UPI00158A9B29|nr:dienelactone hydrolase family protein [Burkholderia sp. BCC1630]